MVNSGNLRCAVFARFCDHTARKNNQLKIPRRVVIVLIITRALRHVFCVRFLLWNITIKLTNPFYPVPLDFSIPVSFTVMIKTDNLRPENRSQSQIFFLTFGCRFSTCNVFCGNSRMRSSKNMINSSLFLVDENSNPQQEFGILIFFPTA